MNDESYGGFGETFHVVCHDCKFEELFEQETSADRAEYLHHGETGHNVEYAEVATDGGEDLSAVFARLAELADADGAVSDDGSGLNGVWTRTIEAADRERDWNVALNANLDEDLEATDFPREEDSTSIPPGKAVIHLGGWPAGVLGPYGGQILVEQLEDGPRSLEDEFLRDVETALLEAGADIDRTVSEHDVAADGGADESEFAVGQLVVSNREFSGVPEGTEGVVDEDYGPGIMVAWDLPEKPLPDGYDRKPEDEHRPMTTDPDGFSVPILRDGFDKETELRFLEPGESESPGQGGDPDGV